MLCRLYDITFPELEQIDLELFTKINNFLSKMENGNYGKVLFPTEDHFEKEMIFKLNNKVLVALYADDVDSAKIISSVFVNFLDESEYNFLLELCLAPLVYISIKGPKYIDNQFMEQFLNKWECLMWIPKYYFNSFSFRLRCQIHEFDVLVDEILGEFENESYEFDVEYYF